MTAQNDLALFAPGTTAGDVLGWLSVGGISAPELMGAVLDRIDALNPDLNALVSLRPRDVLMAEAAATDLSKHLGGLPIAVKDMQDTAGITTTYGSPLFETHVPASDSALPARLRDAGAIIIGKTNTPEFGLGSHTFNPVFGATRNPYRADRTIGGSSGGAAAALAAGLLWMADGSDMMGSLRNPAAYGNLYGFRPTWGRVPGDPSGELYLNRISTDGPMARSVEDIARLFGVLGAADPRWPGAPWTDAGAEFDLDRDIGGTRVGWARDWSGAFPFEDGIIALCEAGLSGLIDQGAEVYQVPAPFPSERLWQSWTDLRAFSIAARRGDHLDRPETRDALKPEVIFEIEKGLSLSAMDLYQASLTRSDWLRTAHDLFEKIDVLVLPSAQVFPFDLDMRYPTEIAGQSMDTYHRWMEVMIPASLLGLPAISVPVGFGPEGTPMGMQLIGAPGADRELLQVAQAYHRATLWPQARPPKLEAAG